MHGPNFDSLFKALLVLGMPIKPLKSSFLTNLVYIYFAVLPGGICYVLTIYESIYIMEHRDLNSMALHVPYFIAHVNGIVKMTLFLAVRKNVWEYSKRLSDDIFQPSLKRGGAFEFRVLDQARKYSNYQCAFFMSLVVSIVINNNLDALRDKGITTVTTDALTNQTITRVARKLPFICWLPKDMEHTLPYEFNLIYSNFGPTVMGLYIGLIDTIICGFMFYLRAQFYILRNSLITFIDRARISAGQIKEHDGEDHAVIYDSRNTKLEITFVGDCVKHHKQILEFCMQAEKFFTNLMLFQILGSVVLLCFHLFQMTLEMSMTKLASNCSFLILFYFQILIFCWIGNEIQLESSNVSVHAYNASWTASDREVKFCLLLMMIRAQRPFVFTAGKFAILSLETFMKIVRGSMSYFLTLARIQSMNAQERK